MGRKIKDIPTGTKFGKWEVLSFSHVSTNRARSAYWDVRCSCGKEAKRSGTSLRKGDTLGCASCANKKGLKHRWMHQAGDDLYMFQCGPYVKIGRTSNVDVRLASIQAANPYPVKLIGLWKGDGHKEHDWHNQLAHLKHSGEWFKLG